MAEPPLMLHDVDDWAGRAEKLTMPDDVIHTQAVALLPPPESPTAAIVPALVEVVLTQTIGVVDADDDRPRVLLAGRRGVGVAQMPPLTDSAVLESQ